MAIAGAQTELERSERSAGGEMEIDLMELCFRLVEKLKYILLAAVLGAVIAGVWTFEFITPTYKATSKLYVVSSNETISLSDFQISNYLASDYIEVFSNWHVHEMVIDRLDLPYTYSEMDKMLSVSNPAGTRILYISITSPSPEEAKIIADTYALVAQEFIADRMSSEKPNVFEEALTPAYPSSPSKTKNIFLGFLAGLVLSVGLFTLQFVLDDRIRTGEEIEKYLGIPSLGMLPGQRETKRLGRRRKHGARRKA